MSRTPRSGLAATYAIELSAPSGVIWSRTTAHTAHHFLTLWVCEFAGLFVFDEVAFRGALDPHLSRASTGRLHACSALFISILWAYWHLPAYNPHAKTFFDLFAHLSLFSLGQVMFGLLLTWMARTSRTLVPSAAIHALHNAYVLALIQ